MAVLAGIASAIVWPFRMAWLLLVRSRRGQVKKVIFLGFDGLDPAITEKLMAEGRLPNFARLRDEGSYRRLRTTFPALSPVAWSTFATGVNPAKHNIFDFLNRDLRTYAPELSSAKVWPGKAPDSRNAAQERAVLEDTRASCGKKHHSASPVTFPPESFNGLELSAMCTPDLLGTQGTHFEFHRFRGRTRRTRRKLRAFSASTTVASRFRANRMH